MIIHITTNEAWAAAAASGIYHAASLDDEGFIHCSTSEQLLMPANAFYRGRQDLILLCIDPGRLEHRLVYEDLYDAGHRFPHIYGPLNHDAIQSVIPFPPNDDGTFDLPPSLSAIQAYPILQHDGTPEAIIEPSRLISPLDIPEHCVLCFFQDAIASLNNAGKLRPIHELVSEIGPNPIYEFDTGGAQIVLAHAGVGAPLSAAFLEELIALGCRKFIACGGCGVLDGSIGVGEVVVPESAVRDEGTSYHYLPPSREVHASPAAVQAIKAVLARHHLDYKVGKTWTMDAIYRETPAKMAQRRAEGCLTVEMEAAAFFAVAQFRGITFGQILYGGDDLTGDTWDNRDWNYLTSTRDKLLQLAVEACLSL